MAREMRIPELTQAQIDKFWSKVRKSRFGCWEWQNARNSRGYGNVRINKRYLIASRVAYFLTKGDPGEFDVLHTCDNPPCCRPSHLFLGTHDDNMADMKAKGRAGMGPPARENALKSLCKHGHPLSGNNLYITPEGYRQCRICRKRWDQQRKEKLRAKSPERVYTSALKGVCWDKSQGKWMAYTRVNGRNVNLGRYASEMEAAEAVAQSAPNNN